MPAAPAHPAILLRHPVEGGAVRAGARVYVDVATALNGEWHEETLPREFQLCLRLGTAGVWACTSNLLDISLVAMTGNDDPSSRFTGRFETLYAALTSASNSTEAAAQLTAGATSSILARVSSTFSVDAPDACARQLGTNGCGRSPPLHCAALPRFRFYLYEQDTAPSPEAAELYYALRDSPLRTLDGDRDRGEACVYVAVGDVRAANVQALPPAAAARAYSRLPHWNGTGADHLIFNFGDYGTCRARGRRGVRQRHQRLQI